MTALPDPIDTYARLSTLPKALLWVIAARVKTLGLSLTPVVAGTGLAAIYGSWNLFVLLAAMGAAGAIQIGTNLWNDAADAASGVDGPDRLGPPRLTALGLLAAPVVRRAALGAFALASGLGVYLTAVGGWPIVAIGLVSLMLGYFYSMGPHPLSGTPLGEVLVIVFFGIIAVTATVHLHGHPVTLHATLLGIVTGLPAAAVLMLNNHRDRASDARAGRRTLAILVGERASHGLYAVFLILSLLGGFWMGGASLWLLSATLLGVVLLAGMIRLPVSAVLNRLIPATALFQMLVVVAILSGLQGG